MTKEHIIYKDLGLAEYRRAWDVQREIFDALVAGKKGGECGDGNVNDVRVQTLILCEHPHVYTLGRSGREDNMLAGGELLERIGADFVRIDRGGDITYHGPGQLVGYPILDLERLGMGLKEYIHALEQAVIDTLADFGITAGRSEGATGVWVRARTGRTAGEHGRDGVTGGEVAVPPRKIAAIGVKSSRFVTMHGFALNVNPAMEYFGHINPCGFTDRGVTSMERELGRPIAMDGVKAVFLRHFARVFGVEVR